MENNLIDVEEILEWLHGYFLRLSIHKCIMSFVSYDRIYARRGLI